ncbi:hypothetical protein C8Q73DRAFT_185261 [Cubamyces lactineus]|nr:hypothetical protein C8Q73DRAFT_185261 [Cubamyces lactineus]
MYRWLSCSRARLSSLSLSPCNIYNTHPAPTRRTPLPYTIHRTVIYIHITLWHRHPLPTSLPPSTSLPSPSSSSSRNQVPYILALFIGYYPPSYRIIIPRLAACLFFFPGCWLVPPTHARRHICATFRAVPVRPLFFYTLLLSSSARLAVRLYPWFMNSLTVWSV